VTAADLPLDPDARQWPRTSLAPPGAPGYQVWAAPIVVAVIALVGLCYLVLARPQRRVHGGVAR
jgi:hypothetical protein